MTTASIATTAMSNTPIFYQVDLLWSPACKKSFASDGMKSFAAADWLFNSIGDQLRLKKKRKEEKRKDFNQLLMKKISWQDSEIKRTTKISEVPTVRSKAIVVWCLNNERCFETERTLGVCWPTNQIWLNVQKANKHLFCDFWKSRLKKVFSASRRHLVEPMKPSRLSLSYPDANMTQIFSKYRFWRKETELS